MMVFNTIFFQSAKSGEPGIDKQAVKFSKSNYLFADIIDVAVDSSEEEVQEPSATAGNESQYLAFAFDIGKGLPSEAVEFYNSVLRIFPKMAGAAQPKNGNGNSDLKSESVILKKEDLNAFLAPLFDELSPINVAPKQDASVPVSLFEVAGTLVLEKAESANLVLALDQHGGDDRLIIINPLSKTDQKSILPGVPASEDYYLVSLVPSPVAIDETTSIAKLVQDFALPLDIGTLKSLGTESASRVIHNPYAEEPSEEEVQISELLTVFNATVAIPVYTYNIIKNTPVVDVDASLQKSWNTDSEVSETINPKIEMTLSNLKAVFAGLFEAVKGEETQTASGIVSGASLVMKTREMMSLLEGLIKSGELTLAGTEGKLNGEDLISSLRYLSYSDGNDNQKIISLEPLTATKAGEADSFQIRFYTITDNQSVEQAIAKLKAIATDASVVPSDVPKVESGKNIPVQLPVQSDTVQPDKKVQQVVSAIREQLTALNEIADIEELSYRKMYPIVWKDEKVSTTATQKVVDVDKMLSDFFTSEKNMKMVFPDGKATFSGDVKNNEKPILPTEVSLTETVSVNNTKNGTKEIPLQKVFENGRVVLDAEGKELKSKPVTDADSKTDGKSVSGFTQADTNSVKGKQVSSDGAVINHTQTDAEQPVLKTDEEPTPILTTAKEQTTKQVVDGKVADTKVISSVPADGTLKNVSRKDTLITESKSSVLPETESVNHKSDTVQSEKKDTATDHKGVVDGSPNKPISEAEVDGNVVPEVKDTTGLTKNEVMTDKQASLKNVDGNVTTVSDKKPIPDQVTYPKTDEKKVPINTDKKEVLQAVFVDKDIEEKLQTSFSQDFSKPLKAEALDTKTLLVSDVEVNQIPVVKEKVFEVLKGKESPVIISLRQEVVKLSDVEINSPKQVAIDIKTNPDQSVEHLNSGEIPVATNRGDAPVRLTETLPETMVIKGKPDEVQKALIEFSNLQKNVSDEGESAVDTTTVRDNTTVTTEKPVTVIPVKEVPEIELPGVVTEPVRNNIAKQNEAIKTVIVINETEETVTEPATVRDAVFNQKPVADDTKVADIPKNETNKNLPLSSGDVEEPLHKLPTQKAILIAEKVAQIIDTVVRTKDDKDMVVTADAEEYGEVNITAKSQNGIQDVEVVISNPVLKKLIAQAIQKNNSESGSQSAVQDIEPELILHTPVRKTTEKGNTDEVEPDIVEPVVFRKKSVSVPETKDPFDDMVTFVKVKSQVHHISGSGKVDELVYSEVTESRPVSDTKAVKGSDTDQENTDYDESQTLINNGTTIKHVPDQTHQNNTGDNSRHGNTHQGTASTGQDQYQETGTFSAELNQIAGIGKAAGKPGVPVSAERVVRDTEIFKEVSRYIARREKDEMILRVQPEHLGKVKIRLVMQQDQMRAQIEVESDAVKKMLESNLPQLFRDAGQAGVQLGAVQISLAQQEPRQAKHGSQKKRSGGKVEESALDDNKELKTQKRMGYNTYEYLA